MTEDAKEKVENYRRTFKARTKRKLKDWYIEGHSASSIDEIANQFREEAEILFSDGELEKHLQYIELLVDAAEKAVEQSPVELNDPDILFNPDVSIENITRDGDRFERAIDDIEE